MPIAIIDGLKKYISENNIRFHMPGHKGKDIWGILADLIAGGDVTEVPGVDNLHNPKAMIAESQRNASRVFGARETFYSINGTTAGIYAAVTSQSMPGDKVLLARDSHKAVYQSLVLGGLDCDYIYPKYDLDDNILAGLDPKDIEEKLKNDQDIKIVIVNYPTYYGICSDMAAIVDIVAKYNRMLIVDEAHGSHLSFHPKLAKSSLELGADIVIQSTHKTLPSLTQTSMLHVGSEKVDLERLKTHMAIYQSTSPSYILLASIDYAVDYMERQGHKKLESLLKKIDEITNYLNNLKDVHVYEKKVKKYPYEFDKTKFLFRIDGIRGPRLEEILRQDYKIQIELSDHYYCLALITALDEIEDLEALKIAIEDISKKNKYKINDDKKFIDIRNIEAQKKLTPYKAFYTSKSSVQLEESIGKIAGEFVIPYPPGIPILVPGEKITEPIIKYIYNLIDENIEILGLMDDGDKIKIINYDK